MNFTSFLKIYFPVEGHLGCFLFPTTIYKAAKSIVEQVSLWQHGVSFGYISKSGIAKSCSRLIPYFPRNFYIDFQSDCTSLHSHQQWRSDPLIPHPLQHKLSYVLLILAILTGVRWNSRVTLIWISLMAKDVEYFLKYFSALWESSVENSLFRSALHF